MIAAHVYGAVVAIGLGYFVAGSPLQVSESLRNMLAVQRTGLWEGIVQQFSAGGFLRPLLLAPIDVAFTLSQGYYHEVFKAVHLVQLVLTAALFINLLQVRTAVAALAVPFGVAVLFGGHTFAGTVVEGFPINSFLTIVICCLLAANLMHGAPAPWRDVSAVLLFVFAALSVETGLLVWVCVVAGWIAGFRGVSARAIAVMTLLLGAYMLLRFGLLSAGAPALVERSSGYGFRVLDPPELIERFGSNPLWFYVYNVVTQVLSVLFGEPKGGVWVLVRGLVQGDLMPRELIAVASSTGATALIAWYAVQRMADWRRGSIEPRDRWLLVALALLAANAAISYPYTKVVIMSPAGAFHALAATIAFGAALERIGPAPALRAATLAATCALALLSTGWTVRLVGIHYSVREKAFLTRNDWTEVSIDPNAAGAALVRHLRDDAISRRVVNPAFASPSARRYFEEAW